MRNNIKLALFYILILGLLSILLCTENSICNDLYINGSLHRTTY